jgi:membrane protease subunit HflK
LLQRILDRYTTGLLIQTVQMQDVHPPKEVVDAFKDVASAREDKSKTINEAEAERNKIIPETRGLVAEILNQAEAYKATVTHKAEGEAKRFLAILDEYNKAKDVTRKRLYIEAIEEILSAPGMEKIIIGKEAGRGVLPYLPLDRLRGPNAGGGN